MIAQKVDLSIYFLVIYKVFLLLTIPKVLQLDFGDLKMFVDLKLSQSCSLMRRARNMFCTCVVRAGT